MKRNKTLTALRNKSTLPKMNVRNFSLDGMIERMQEIILFQLEFKKFIYFHLSKVKKLISNAVKKMLVNVLF